MTPHFQKMILKSLDGLPETIAKAAKQDNTGKYMIAGFSFGVGAVMSYVSMLAFGEMKRHEGKEEILREAQKHDAKEISR